MQRDSVNLHSTESIRQTICQNYKVGVPILSFQSVSMPNETLIN